MFSPFGSTATRFAASSRHGPRRGAPDVGKLLYGKRKNAVHTTSSSKPSVVAILQQTSIEGLAEAVRHAVTVKELRREDILAVLKSNRALHRFDRSEALAKALRDSRQPLTEYHYSILLAHANDDRNEAKAQEIWKAAARDGKATDLLHSALLSTFRNSGHWQQALRHCEAMWEDERRLDAFGLHATMNACRKSGRWEEAMGVFHKAVEKGVSPNHVVYLELLRTIHDSPLEDKARYGIAILDALAGRTEVTAGHYNAVLAMLSGAQWQKGVELFEEMKRRAVQPSRDTLNILLLLQPHNVSHCIRCVAEAHALGMPVTDTMYRAVLSNLFRMQLDHEAVQFAEREYQEALNDVGNPVHSTLSLSMALLDAVLAHPRPRDALLVLRTFEERLSEVVSPAARGLGVMGKASQRWMVQGRVAVVDHNVLLSPRFDSLVSHYDSLFIPYTSVRLLVRRARDQADTPRGRYMRVTLLRLAETLRTEEFAMVRVLPFAHQILAHTYLHGGPTSSEDVAAVRREAQRGLTAGETLLRRITSDEDSADAAARAAHGEPSSVPVHIRTAASTGLADGNAPAALQEGASTDLVAKSLTSRRSFSHSSRRVTSVERVLAVAVMIKSLNPDTDVHLLSNNAAQLGVVGDWNKEAGQTAITAVRFPDELFDKAPPELCTASFVDSDDTRDRKTSSAVSREQTRGGRLYTPQ